MERDIMGLGWGGVGVGRGGEEGAERVWRARGETGGERSGAGLRVWWRVRL